jgi:hypothetical protein
MMEFLTHGVVHLITNTVAAHAAAPEVVAAAMKAFGAIVAVAPMGTCRCFGVCVYTRPRFSFLQHDLTPYF